MAWIRYVNPYCPELFSSHWLQVISCFCGSSFTAVGHDGCARFIVSATILSSYLTSSQLSSILDKLVHSFCILWLNVDLFDQFYTKMLHLQWATLANKITLYFEKMIHLFKGQSAFHDDFCLRRGPILQFAFPIKRKSREENGRSRSDIQLNGHDSYVTFNFLPVQNVWSIFWCCYWHALLFLLMYFITK